MTDLSFVTLKKAEKGLDTTDPSWKAVLMGDCATQHLATAIRGYGALRGYRIALTDIDYNQIDAQILDDYSELYTAAPDFVIIFLCTEKLQRAFSLAQDKSTFADRMFEKISSYWDAISVHINTSMLQFTFLEEDDRVFGNYALKTEQSFLFQVRKLNYLLTCAVQKRSNVYLIELNAIEHEIGHRLRDEKMYYIAKMPISIDYLPQVAAQLVSFMAAVRGRVKKCIICDLDNTLWGGVIGDDGICGIQIGELGVGHAFEDLQVWLKDLKERGIILGVCSKNNEETAKEPFEMHPEMVLKLDDFSIFVANWEDKASNLVSIQKTLNIGMDSIVFLDDNPFERNLVRNMIPDITVPELPKDPAMYLSYLKSLNLFETASFSDSDKDRTKQYRAEIGRLSSQKQFESYDEYLESLEMVATVSPFDAFQTPRIAQLTQRSNQFNLRTVRCTENDIALMAADPDYITRCFMLRDKFGDHGLISVLILKKANDHTLFIENWLMSCRVLKRGMEEYIINTLMDIAAAEDFDTVVGEYIRTPKNAMVSDIYARFGFTPVGDGKWIIHPAEYEHRRVFIASQRTDY